jgi:hypothetical protein
MTSNKVLKKMGEEMINDDFLEALDNINQLFPDERYMLRTLYFTSKKYGFSSFNDRIYKHVIERASLVKKEI